MIATQKGRTWLPGSQKTAQAHMREGKAGAKIPTEAERGGAS